MDANYQIVNTNDSDESVDRTAKVRSILKQVLICSLIWIQFFVSGLCSGAPTVIIPQMNKEANATIIDDDLSSWIYAAPTISNTPWIIILPLFTKHYGRKIPQTIMSFVCIAIFIGMYMSSSPYHLLVAQLIQGYLHCGNLTIAVLILTEYSTPKLRGMFLTASAAAYFWGIWISNVIGTFFNWRIIPILGLICSLYMLTVFLWPESPHWLASKGRFEECKAAFRRLHGSIAEKELQELVTAKEEYIKLEKSEVKQGFFDIIKCPEFYKPMILAVIAVMQYQFSGKMICSSFILDIFRNITKSEFMSYMAMLILNGVTVISMYVGSYLSKVLKRRILYISSSFIGVAFLLIISLYIYLVKINITEENNYILILLLTVYTIAISCGPTMILSMTIYGELFSTRFQSGSYIIISLVISTSYSILFKMTPTIFADLGIHGSFLLYGIICGLCTFYLYVFLPETKNKTQWEVEEYFRGNKRQTDKLLCR